MKSFTISKDVIVVFVYSLLLKVIVCFTQTYPTGASYMAFPICLMAFTCICISRYKSEIFSSGKIVLTILAGTLVLTVPIRLVDFAQTAGSLPEEILGIAGIFSGWLISQKYRIWVFMLCLLLFIISSYVLLLYFPVNGLVRTNVSL